MAEVTCIFYLSKQEVQWHRLDSEAAIRRRVIQDSWLVWSDYCSFYSWTWHCASTAGCEFVY